VRAALHGWTVRHAPGWRAVPVESLHVTLVFLGATPPERVEDLLAALHAVEAIAPVLRPAEVHRLRRLVALELADEGARAAGLAARLATAFARLGLHEPEKRSFWAHVTLARARQGARPSAPSGPFPAIGAFTTSRAALFASAGGRYERLGFRDLSQG